MKANYQLKVDKSRKKSAIVLHCSLDSKSIQYHVGISIEPKQWSKKNHKVHSGVTDSAIHNDKLQSIRSAAMLEYSNFNNKSKTFTLEYLKQFLDDKFKYGKTNPEFIEDYFIEYMNDKVKRVDERTSATYKTFYTHLQALQQHYKIKIAYTDLNQDFYNKFIDYFVDVEKHENRTIKDKHLSALSSFLNWSVSKDYITKNPYSHTKFPFKISPADTVSLNESELNILYNLDLKSERLDRVRDIFCLECFCGVRYSDMSKVLPENLKGNHLDIITQKTSEPLHIPLRKEALNLIHKYFDKQLAFPTLSNQKLNDYIKELCELAGFNEQIALMSFSGKTKTTEVFEKFKLISTHTARRTFATLSYLRGIDPFVIMKITGHKDLKTFQIYLRLDHLQVSEKFFSSYATIQTAYSTNEIISNLIRLKVKHKIIAEAFGIEIENIPEE